MIKILIDLLEYLRVNAPLLTSLALLTLIFILLAKSIKKHPGIYYTLFAIPFVLVALPSLGKLFGIEIAGFVRIPILGEIVRDYIHMGTFGHPLLIIIMYIGALNVRQPAVKKLMSIRKEMSIICGFAVFAHSLIRVMNSVPSAYKYFADREAYLADTKVASELGAGFSSFSFLLGVFMLLLFIPLWVTSFDAVRKRMGQVRWKKLQRWSYVLYATLFIHAVGIQIGGMMNPRGGQTPRPATTVNTTIAQNQPQSNRGESHRPASGEIRGNNQSRSNEVAKQAQATNAKATPQASGGRTPSKTLKDFNASASAKRYIHLLSLFLIYGSYLFLRLRKAKRDAAKRANRSLINN